MILDFIPLLSIILITSSLLFYLGSLSPFDPTLHYPNYNTVLAFSPANQTQTNNDTDTTAGITIDTKI